MQKIRQTVSLYLFSTLSFVKKKSLLCLLHLAHCEDSGGADGSSAWSEDRHFIWPQTV